MGCFWTDWVGVTEDCSDTPPPVAGVFNVQTWNFGFSFGEFGGSSCRDTSCLTPFDTSGADQFGDLIAQSVDTTGSIGPTAADAVFDIPVRSIVRTPFPSCLVGAGGSDILDITFHVSNPNPGVDIGWTLVGTYNFSPFALGVQVLDPDGVLVATIRDVADGQKIQSEILTGTNTAPDTATLTPNGPSVTLNGLADLGLENATLRLTLRWVDPPTTGVNLNVVSVDLGREWACPS